MAKIKDSDPCPCRSGKTYGECHGLTSNDKKKVVITKEVALSVIPEPDPGTRAMFCRTGDGTVAFGAFGSNVALVCGKCGAHLTEGIPSGGIANIVLRCNGCGSFNEVVGNEY